MPMQEKRTENRNKPTRYIVERVYSGKESMEQLLTSVTEEVARQNVEDKLGKQKNKDGCACYGTEDEDDL